MKLLRTAGVLALSAFALSACDSVTGVTVADLEGAWDAVEYKYTDNANPSFAIDVINGLGGTLSIDVTEGGSFSGTLDVPNVTPQPLPIGGSFTINGDTLVVDFDATTEGYGLVGDFDALFDLDGDVLTFSNDDVMYDFNDTLEAGAGLEVRGEVSATVSVELNR